VLALAACSGRAVWLADGSGPGLDRSSPDGRRLHDLPLAEEGRRDHRLGCVQGPRLVYVVAADHKLYTFDPSQPTAAAAFQLRATLSCPLPGSPHSMAVRMDGKAYVLYTALTSGGRHCTGLARVDLDTMTCVAVKAYSCGTGGFDVFGMGYAIAASGAETLYIGNDEAKFARLDPEAGMVDPIGALPEGGPELTGNSNGELWGFFPKVVPARVHRIDQSTGKALATLPLAKFTTPWAGAFAFAAWGGLFYIFYGYNAATSTDVFRLTSDGALTPLFLDTGLTIVGAGVSTCAPGG
jgi:hypothetical protein